MKFLNFIAKVEKFYYKIFFKLYRKFKPKNFNIVTFENFLNVFLAFEKNLPKCNLFTLPSIPFNKKRYEILTRQIGTQPTEAFFLIRCIHESLKVEGICCEFGVAQGQTSVLIANELKEYSNKSLYLFDSFEGLPKPTKEDKLIDDIFEYGDIMRYQGSMKCPKKSVIKKLAEINMDKKRYKIIPGFVEESFIKNNNLPYVSFAYIDFDFYDPIRIVLESLLIKLRKGSIVVVDDYDYFSSGVKLAVDNFLNDNKEVFESYVAPKYIGNFIILKCMK